NIIGIGMGGPTLITWGTEVQKHQLLRGLATNEEIWCQLFSEPGAGSDVAGLSTRAVRDGDEWIVTGQKVWTTVAHLSTWGMLLARTHPASRCAPSCRSRATPSSTRSSWKGCASPTRCASAPRAKAGVSRSPRS